MSLSAAELYAREDIPEPQAERDFYSLLKMRNGTFKTTRVARFDDLNPDVVSHLRTNLPPEPQVLDVAVSAGVSTAELAEALHDGGIAPHITATDLFIDGWLVKAGPGLKVLVDREGWPLRYSFGSTSTRPWTRRLDYLTLAFLPRLAAHKALAGRLCRLARSGTGQPVRLASSRLSEFDNISLVEDDVFARRAGFEGRFDFIRAANILNVNYFSEPDLTTAIDNLRSYLKGPGSALLVTRTLEDRAVNAASLFSVSPGGRLKCVKTFNGGSEIENLVLRACG